ncbi:MAG: hypothetical protein Q8911_00225 [Bacillota bacterium]|nr:hypothetical protein [Bacillota bacterium]
MKNKFLILGDVTVIFLQKVRGKQLRTIIDTVDLPRAQEFPHTWTAGIKDHYVRGKFQEPRNGRKNPPIQTVSLHRWITNASSGLQVDHKNHIPLDNRRSENLRIGTQSLNQQNRKEAYCKSGYRGVYPKGNKWKVEIMVQGKRFYLGIYGDKKFAAQVASEARAACMPFTQEILIS